MREIKFRGKRISDSKWNFGVPYRSEGTWWMLVDDNTRTQEIGTGSYQIITETIAQYTGLNDKNGKEIYEGDILGVSGSNEYAYVIEWNHNNGCFTSIDGGIDNFIGDIDDEINFNLLSNMRLDLSVVIGNIHDNPELLEVV